VREHQVFNALLGATRLRLLSRRQQRHYHGRSRVAAERFSERKLQAVSMPKPDVLVGHNHEAAPFGQAGAGGVGKILQLENDAGTCCPVTAAVPENTARTTREWFPFRCGQLASPARAALGISQEELQYHTTRPAGGPGWARSWCRLLRMRSTRELEHNWLAATRLVTLAQAAGRTAHQRKLSQSDARIVRRPTSPPPHNLTKPQNRRIGTKDNSGHHISECWCAQFG
jgi:hypothetical protein